MKIKSTREESFLALLRDKYHQNPIRVTIPCARFPSSTLAPGEYLVVVVIDGRKEKILQAIRL